MALKKKIEKYGVEVEYIIVDRIDYVKQTNSTHFTVSYYKDEAERRLGLERRIFTDSYSFPRYMSIVDCYEFLKAPGSILEGSEDVFEEKEEEPLQENISE